MMKPAFLVHAARVLFFAVFALGAALITLDAQANPSATGVLNNDQELVDDYEYGQIVKSVYYGKNSMNGQAVNNLFLHKYLIGQFGALIGREKDICSILKLSEYRKHQIAAAPAAADQSSAMTIDTMKSIMTSLNSSRNMNDYKNHVQRNTTNLLKEQGKIEDAEVYGQRDIVTFFSTYGHKDCHSPEMNQYAKSLRTILNRFAE